MDQPVKPQNWVIENFDDLLQFGFRRSEILFSEQTAYQTVEVIQSPTHGRLLMVDGCFMLCERDEAIFHEMMAHVPMFTHKNPKNVLIIGGGDGGTAREVLRHPSIEKCVLVEQDEAIIRASKEFFPQMAGVFSSPRLKCLVEDGLEWVEKAALNGIASCDLSLKEIEKFDIIFIESTDPLGFAHPVFGDLIYFNLKKILAPDGVIISQAESPFYSEDAQKILGINLKKHFSRVHFYNFSNLTYPGGLWSFSFASDTVHPIDDLSRSRVSASGLNFTYYNQGVHEGAFLLPEFQKLNLRDILNPL